MKKITGTKKVMLINAQHPEECRAVILNNNLIEDYIVEHSSRELINDNITELLYLMDIRLYLLHHIQ